jgi:quinol monooxygenase YgiN
MFSGGNMSHTVMVELTCLPGLGQEYVETMLPLLGDTRAFEGCELVEVYADQDNSDKVFLWEKWAARSDQEAYLAWRTETGTLQDMNRFLATDPRFIHLSPSE